MNLPYTRLGLLQMILVEVFFTQYFSNLYSDFEQYECHESVDEFFTSRIYVRISCDGHNFKR